MITSAQPEQSRLVHGHFDSLIVDSPLTILGGRDSAHSHILAVTEAKSKVSHRKGWDSGVE